MKTTRTPHRRNLIHRKVHLIMPKNIILKIKKIGSLKKFLSPKNCKNGQKRAKNGRFLDPQGRILRKSKKGLDILLPLPQRGCIPNFRKFGSSDLEKMRYKRTNGKTDGTEIIGPSGKIPGTNYSRDML